MIWHCCFYRINVWFFRPYQMFILRWLNIINIIFILNCSSDMPYGLAANKTKCSFALNNTKNGHQHQQKERCSCHNWCRWALITHIDELRLSITITLHLFGWSTVQFVAYCYWYCCCIYLFYRKWNRKLAAREQLRKRQRASENWTLILWSQIIKYKSSVVSLNQIFLCVCVFLWWAHSLSSIDFQDILSLDWCAVHASVTTSKRTYYFFVCFSGN